MAPDVPQKEFYDALADRIGVSSAERLKGSTAGIAGLGGLGSHIALSLARSGIGRLVVADFDDVDLSNIHRQCYPLSAVGMPKTDAIRNEIARINPWCNVECHHIRIDKENVSIFSDCDVVCEAFDDAQQKIMLIKALSGMDKTVVSGNGMAGIGDSNSIVTRKIADKIYVCGDGESDVRDEGTITESRVAVCAAHQANAAVRIILGLEP